MVDVHLNVDEINDYIKAASKRTVDIIIVVALVIILSFMMASTTWFFTEYGIPLDYIPYVHAAEIFIFGSLIVEKTSAIIMKTVLIVAGMAVAKGVKTITRIVGYGVLISLLASVFKADPAAALAMGGFMAVVVGYATQQVLGNAVAGVFLVMSRPFKIGDKVKLLGKYEGTVSEITVMFTIIDSGERRVLIPSTKIIGDVIEVIKEEKASS